MMKKNLKNIIAISFGILQLTSALIAILTTLSGALLINFVFHQISSISFIVILVVIGLIGAAITILLEFRHLRLARSKKKQVIPKDITINLNGKFFDIDSAEIEDIELIIDSLLQSQFNAVVTKPTDNEVSDTNISGTEI